MKHIDFKHIILAAILAIACMPATFAQVNINAPTGLKKAPKLSPKRKPSLNRLLARAKVRQPQVKVVKRLPRPTMAPTVQQCLALQGQHNNGNNPPTTLPSTPQGPTRNHGSTQRNPNRSTATSAPARTAPTCSRDKRWK